MLKCDLVHGRYAVFSKLLSFFLFCATEFMSVKVLIIIPCFNEEQSLPGLLANLKDCITQSAFTVIPVVINDCSRDGSETVARSFGVNVLNLPNNLGIGGAVQTGIKYALSKGFDYCIQMDGDGQHPPAEFEKLVNNAIKTGADVVIGSRFLTGEGFQSTFIRRLGIKYFHFLNRILTGKSIHDITSGYRLLGEKAMKLAANYYPDDYPEPESLVFFSKHGLKIVEVPVTMHHRQGGKSSIGTFASVYYWVKVTAAMFYSYIRKQ